MKQSIITRAIAAIVVTAIMTAPLIPYVCAIIAAL